MLVLITESVQSNRGQPEVWLVFDLRSPAVALLETRRWIFYSHYLKNNQSLFYHTAITLMTLK